ncbi:SDR family NAD(P)-dependent oxidoreductase [Brevibacillus laterosporus]|uniref:SDR family NAD(P)-dependent oxidoreductase n=1 Tax=Brevibacillus laterosporus TaxID=1465 RepID=A0AAP3G7X6_BRELA|nr:SDR family NAD(P)-dependent oxidoreductase [Brevibacillus laterosporus]MCR8980763.1 SDR family NAD(P)-dependent oxidoreductase [Brevibacillus laterosporus]MCZ0807918.1 SDR family NAD(P)-dependent oxidoreductase [Brevibacillus laterosporus]MCZ0826191.1 SDR family NAD(P)-dependent oxidoreductase [Brevibacillus laterosporus]MCZ0851202.1 SDR family NAD(P)-dependent oxidoreductase [Brevibacillus laterosporus]
MKKYLIFGASKGLGDAFVKGLPNSGDQVWIVSRSRPNSLDINDGVQRIWLEVDLSQQNKINMITETLQNERIDVLIYNVGVWEKEGFEDHYDFEHDDPEDIATIININITSTITYIQALLPNLRKSESGKIVLIGSTAGLDNTNNSQVSFVTSKFGLRGITNALREHVRKDGIAVTCINPGELAAEIPYEAGAEKAIAEYNGTRIPVQGIVSLVKCVVSLSKVSCVKEIHVPAITDLNA